MATDKIQNLIELREKARLGGGQKRIDSQHSKGKLTARERIEMNLATVLSGLVGSRSSIFTSPTFKKAVFTF